MSICKLTQTFQITINQIAMNPQQVYIAARQLLGINNNIAYPAAQFLSIYQCEIIKSYHFEQSIKCYKSFPIKYKKHNKEYKKFFIPATKDIVLLDTEIPCTKPVTNFFENFEKEIFMRKGSLLKTAYINYTTVPLLEHIPNIT